MAAITSVCSKHMQKEGFSQTFDVNIDQLLDKTFHTYRKSKTLNEDVYHKWNPFNLVNKHFTRATNQSFEDMLAADIPKRIYQSRPHIVLNIGNEYLSFMLMEKMAGKSISTPLLTLPFRVLQHLRLRHAIQAHLHQIRQRLQRVHPQVH